MKRLIQICILAPVGLIFMASSSLAQNGLSSAPMSGSTGGSGTGSGSASAGTSEEVSTEQLPATESLREIPGAAIMDDDNATTAVRVNPGDTAGRVVASTYEDPESGFAGVMREAKWLEMGNNLLSSPLSLQKIARQLTDPGVAEGSHQAAQEALGIINITYLQQLHEFQKEAIMGGVGVQRALERMSCVQQERAKLVEAGEEDNWYRASAICRRALDISAPTGSAPGESVEPMNTDGEVEPSSVNLAAQEPVDCKDIQDPKSLVDIYLLPEREVTLADGSKKTIRVQEDFKARFGDIIDGTAPNSTPGVSNRVYCSTTAPNPGRVQMYDLRNQLWHDFFALLEERCKAAPLREGSIAQNYVPFDPAQRTAFWRLNATSMGKRFDFGSYQFKPATVDIIYGMFIAKELREVNEEACTRRLSPDVDANNIELLIKGGKGQDGKPVRVRDEHRFVSNMLAYVARGQILDIASNWVVSLRPDSPQSFLRTDAPASQLIQFMTERIARFAGVEDLSMIQPLRLQNQEQFMQFIGTIHQLGAEQSGKGGKGLIDAFGAVEASKGGTIGSGIAGQGNF